MTVVEWHGGKAYSTCAVCSKPVQINKPGLGSIHVCLNECEQAGRHLDLRTRTRGPLWQRRDEKYCAACSAVQ
jgi:hypothetical protein